MIEHGIAENPQLSIVIVSWNTRDMLDACLRSVYDTTTEVSFDVWVVDNASCDGSPEMVREKYPDVHLLENEKNEGFGRANNRAISASRGEAVLLLNSDVVLTPGAVDSVYLALRRHEKVAALGCTLRWPDGEIQRSWETYLAHGPRLKSAAELEDGMREALLVWAAFLMVKREVYDAVGLFDEDFRLFYEDTDWCWRVHNAGWRLAVCTDISVIHGSRQSAGRLPDEVYWQWMFTAEYLLYRKHHSALAHRVHMTRKLISYDIKSRLHWWYYRLTGSELHKEVTWRLRLALTVIRRVRNPNFLEGSRAAVDRLWLQCETPADQTTTYR